jgi:hypothetical protein
MQIHFFPARRGSGVAVAGVRGWRGQRRCSPTPSKGLERSAPFLFTHLVGPWRVHLACFWQHGLVVQRGLVRWLVASVRDTCVVPALSVVGARAQALLLQQIAAENGLSLKQVIAVVCLRLCLSPVSCLCLCLSPSAVSVEACMLLTHITDTRRHLSSYSHSRSSFFLLTLGVIFLLHTQDTHT